MAHGSSVTYRVAPAAREPALRIAFDLGVRAAELPVPSFTDHFAIPHDRRADQRIWLDAAQTALRQFQRRAM